MLKSDTRCHSAASHLLPVSDSPAADGGRLISRSPCKPPHRCHRRCRRSQLDASFPRKKTKKKRKKPLNGLFYRRKKCLELMEGWKEGGGRGCSCREQPEGGSAVLFLVALPPFIVIWASENRRRRRRNLSQTAGEAEQTECEGRGCGAGGRGGKKNWRREGGRERAA